MSFTESLKEIVERNQNGLLGAHPAWERVRLGDICEVQNGFAFPSSGFKQDAGTPLLRIRDVLKADTEVRYDGEFDPEYLVEPGDLVVGMDGDFRCALWKGPPSLLNQRVCRLLPNERLYNKRFLAHVLQGYLSAINAKTSAVTVKHLSSKTVADIPLPLPGLAEQCRVAEYLDETTSDLCAAVAGLRRAQANLKRYRASVLQAAVEGRLVPTEAELAREEGREYESAKVLLDRILAERRHRWEEAELESLKAKGKPPTNDKWKSKYKTPAEPDTLGLPELPEGWVWASLEQLSSAERVICYGILMPKEHVPDGVLYVKVRDMRGNRLDVAKLPRTSPEIAAKYERASLRAGDLLLAIRGTYGRVVEVPPELEGGNITQDTARLALHERLNRGYVRAYLLSPDAQNYFKRVARGVAVKGVNIAEVRTTPVSVPPIGEQERILKEVDRHMSLVDELEAETDRSLKRADQLRQRILATAFEGKLIAQNPTDEPANELLERIQADRAAVEAKSSSRARRKKA